MKKDKKEQLKNHITQKIAELKDDIESYKELTKPVAPDNAIGRITRMEAIGSKSINEAALRKAKKTLLRLEKVSRIIDDPDFGFCSICEEAIPFGRLMAIPESDVCVQCATKAGR